jgi:hypothetical protein
MTSWRAPESPIRYYQCPFCQRTHSSLYGEVFRRRAGARLVRTPLPQDAGEASQAASPAQQIPMASPDDVRWARVKASAARWFARLDAEGQARPAPPSGPAATGAARAAATEARVAVATRRGR